MVSQANTRTRLLAFVVALVLLPAGIIAIPAPVAFAAKSHCPSGGTPPPGSRVNGGLDVDGTCILDRVTVNGGITVEAGGHLQLTRSIVNGGIVALPCGELDINARTLGSGMPTHTTSTIHGGIDINASNSNCPRGTFSNVDIWTAQISGEVSMTGNFARGAFPEICGNEIKGSVTLHNVTVIPVPGFPEGTVGDPDGFFGCPGNTISGSLLLFGSSIFAVESNKIGGSVFLVASTLELNGNTIHGSLMCSNGTKILPGEATDPVGNTVHGENTCP